MIIGGHALLGMDADNVQLWDTILEAGDDQSAPWGWGEAEALVIRLDTPAVASGVVEHDPSRPPPASYGRV